jgi:hypothetical protein
MAANPLPREFTPGATMQNAATTTSFPVVPGQEIEWQNETLFAIQITAQPINGVYPFEPYTFSVPGKHNQTIGTYLSTVAANASGTYTFTRTGATPMGNGRIVVSTGK